MKWYKSNLIVFKITFTHVMDFKIFLLNIDWVFSLKKHLHNRSFSKVYYHIGKNVNVNYDYNFYFSE